MRYIFGRLILAVSLPVQTRRIDEEAALRAVVSGTASQTGTSFYKALVENLARTLDTSGAWVTRYNRKREEMRALAFFMGEQWLSGVEYPVAGTACETVIKEKRLIHIPDRVLELYPKDKDPAFSSVVSYLGMPILDERDRVIGHVAVVDTRPMPEDKRLLSLFQLFAARVGAEMRRTRLEAALRAREEKLSRLIGSAMDAIVEVNAEGVVTMANAAAEKVFESEAQALLGQKLEDLLGPVAAAKVGELCGRLEDPSADNCHLWIPGPIEVRPQRRDAFRAEGTLCRYEARGKSFATLILRNVDDRLQAEQRIQSLSAKADYLQSEIDQERGFGEIIGSSSALRAALTAVAQVAATDATVLVYGETGTGKELFARAIHRRSARSGGPLINVNCAAIPANLIESEFFGHERGAFTGATQQRDGRFALADGGTIFLDEIGELPLDMQGKLLRVLQEGEFDPVGSSRTRRVDVRVVAATNRDLEQAVKDGSFRADLYYRLSVFPLRLPPLRERGGDVAEIAAALAGPLARRLGTRAEPLTENAVALLKAYDWPGNVRELRNVIERAIIVSRGEALRFEHALAEALAPDPASEPSIFVASSAPTILTEKRLRAMERSNMLAALERCNWRVQGEAGAAALIGISPSTFKSRMKAFGIERARSLVS